MPFDNPPNPMYSQDDWTVMQAAYDKAAATLLVQSSSEDEAKIISETVMMAFNRGNRDVNSLAALAVITAINSHPAAVAAATGKTLRVARATALYNFDFHRRFRQISCSNCCCS